ncbi:MAG: N-acetylmuramoyl-L-alanine amidase [Nocardiaceae bacterium]|nr:N-acetylmuramoyl-L-alanine amidase [Nocardiaceae bacterium]
MHLLRRGDEGPAVAEIRASLASLGYLHYDGPAAASNGVWNAPAATFDADLETAVRAFQQARGLLVDGIVGPATYRALKEASYHLGARFLFYQLSSPLYGDDVAALQRRLQELGYYVGRVDGYFGLHTHEALTSFQREFGLAPDGICGPETLRSVELLGRSITGGNPHAMTEEELVRSAGPHLTGKRIVIDPGLGGTTTGLTLSGPDGDTTEAAVLWDLANRLEGRMAATGMETFLSRPKYANPSDSERAELSNSFAADLMISLRLARNDTPTAHGIACFYYGHPDGTSASMIGQALAGYIQREIVARTSLLDCRSHSRVWDILRLTKMPTVQIDVAFASNPEDAALLANSRMRDIIAEAILVAVKRLYLLGQNDQPTGTFTFADLLAEEQNREV